MGIVPCKPAVEFVEVEDNYSVPVELNSETTSCCGNPFTTPSSAWVSYSDHQRSTLIPVVVEKIVTCSYCGNPRSDVTEACKGCGAREVKKEKEWNYFSNEDTGPR